MLGCLSSVELADLISATQRAVHDMMTKRVAPESKQTHWFFHWEHCAMNKNVIIELHSDASPLSQCRSVTNHSQIGLWSADRPAQDEGRGWWYMLLNTLPLYSGLIQAHVSEPYQRASLTSDFDSTQWKPDSQSVRGKRKGSIIQLVSSRVTGKTADLVAST